MAGKRLEKKKKMKTSDRILILLGAFLLAFILSMMITFWVKESVPDTLIQYTLGAGGEETVVLAGIKISKVVTGEKSSGESEDSYEREDYQETGESDEC